MSKSINNKETAAHPSTTALIDLLDQRLIVVMRDGRNVLGTLRSFDQFANIVLEGCCERIYVGRKFGDIPLGLFIIRGENVMLMSQMDLEKEAEIRETDEVPMEEILQLKREADSQLSEEAKRAKNVLLGGDGFY